ATRRRRRPAMRPRSRRTLPSSSRRSERSLIARRATRMAAVGALRGAPWLLACARCAALPLDGWHALHDALLEHQLRHVVQLHRNEVGEVLIARLRHDDRVFETEVEALGWHAQLGVDRKDLTRLERATPVAADVVHRHAYRV